MENKQKIDVTNIYKTDYMQNVEMLKSTRFEQTGVENCGLYTVKTLAGGCVVGVNNVKKWRIYAQYVYV